METRIALVAGATGLVGKHLLEQLLNDPLYEGVIALVRKPISMRHAKLEQLVIDFDKLNELEISVLPDDVFCALGTTIKTAGSQAAFRKVDLEYVVALSKWCERKQVKRFLVVSAMGADPASRVFYNRVKGQMEAGVEKSLVSERHIFRPSLLMGNRNEKRSGEKLAQEFMKVFGFVFAGKMLKYKGIEAEKVAAAMIAAARKPQPGCHVHLSDEMQHVVPNH